jgi:hypothetical protein
MSLRAKANVQKYTYEVDVSQTKRGIWWREHDKSYTPSADVRWLPAENRGVKLREEREREWLGSNVCKLFCSGDVLKSDAPIRNVVSEMM